MSVVESVWDELSSNQQQMYEEYINNRLFSLVRQEDIDMMAVGEIKEIRNQLSIPDCSSLVYAEQVDGILLTSDKNLRTTATARGVNVHGHLWMFDEMVNSHAILPQEAINKLSELCSVINTKLGLPASECEARVKIWSSL